MTAMELDAPARPLPRGAALGLLFGANGWAFGLALAALAAGRPGVLLTHVVPGVLVTTVLALTLLAATNRARRASLRKGQRVLVGGLLVVVGLLLLGTTWFLEPLLREEDFDGVLTATGSVRHISPLFAGTALIAGLLVLGSVALRRSGGSK